VDKGLGAESSGAESPPVAWLNHSSSGSSSLSAGACEFEPAAPVHQEEEEQERDDGYNGGEEEEGPWFGSAPEPKKGVLVPDRVFIGGISCQTTENDLVKVFSAFGHVRGAKIIFDRGGVSKGFGFITYETREEAQGLCKSVLKKVRSKPSMKNQH
jgi:RNA recognition motif-containing protein